MATFDQYRDREHWSFSALNQFLNICSLQFAFQRIYRLESVFTPVSLSFGSVFHRAMEWLHLLRKEGRQPAENEARDLFRDLWSRQVREEPNIRFDEEVTADSCGAQGADLVAAYLKAADPEEQVLAVNEAFAVPLVDAHGQVLEKPLVGELDCRNRENRARDVIDEPHRYVTGWLNYYGLGDTYTALLELAEWVRRRVRLYYWKQWKQPRTRRRHLLALGIPREEVHLATRSRKGHWRMSSNSILQRALTNRWLQEQGVPDMRTLWTVLHYGPKARV